MEKCDMDKITPVSQNYYENTFNTEFNLDFGKPKMDVCSKCDGE